MLARVLYIQKAKDKNPEKKASNVGTMENER